MNAHDQANEWTTSGRFLIWEPDLKSRDHHRLVDSDRPATSFFKQGSLTINAGTVFFEKNRHFVRLLTFVLSTPLWVGLAFGLVALVWPLFGHEMDTHAGTAILIALAIAVTTVALLIGRFIKPIRRQYLISQVTNVQLKNIQMTRNNVPVSSGRLGVDFCVVPADSMDLNRGQPDSSKPADALRCSFVTFIAESQSEASGLEKWLPKKQVPLTGKRDPNIPPQQNARWVESHTVAGVNDPTASNSAIPAQQRYRHGANKWSILLGAAFFGGLMLFVGHEAVTNNRGLLINGIIRLGPTGATIFYSLFAMLMTAGFSLMAAISLQCFLNPHSLEMRADGIVFWGGWLKSKPIFVPFAAIQTIGRQQNVKGGARTLVLGANNQQFQIYEARLENRQTYDEINATITLARQPSTGRPSRAAAVKTPGSTNQPPECPPDDDSRYMPKE